MPAGQNPAKQKLLVVKREKPAIKKTNPAVQLISQKTVQMTIAAAGAIIIHATALRLTPLPYHMERV